MVYPNGLLGGHARAFEPGCRKRERPIQDEQLISRCRTTWYVRRPVAAGEFVVELVSAAHRLAARHATSLFVLFRFSCHSGSAFRSARACLRPFGRSPSSSACLFAAFASELPAFGMKQSPKPSLFPSALHFASRTRAQACITGASGADHRPGTAPASGAAGRTRDDL